jgi:hypothetical protein
MRWPCLCLRTSEAAKGTQLWPHLHLQVEHHARHARAVRADAHHRDIGIGLGDLRLQLGDQAGAVLGIQVEHQALGVFQREQAVIERLARLEGDPRVIARRPDARGDDLRFGGG